MIHDDTCYHKLANIEGTNVTLNIVCIMIVTPKGVRKIPKSLFTDIKKQRKRTEEKRALPVTVECLPI